ncbi:MAG TPA: c-type cytochrome, partial [Pirellulales bacterium]|nr:c-type cytochrome [Pirellulales bacterium]
QGGHYEPWRNRPSSLYAYERLPTCADHLHYPSGRPSAMRGETQETLDLGGGHAHCGTLVYLGDSFPPEYRNTVFMCNVHGRRINRDLLDRKGSGYTARHGADFLVAGDPWFMGVTLQTGPDGSVFVSDWSDTGECHTYEPQRDTGRIYKVSYGKAGGGDAVGGPSRSVRGGQRVPPQPRDLAGLGDVELARLHLHQNDWFVRHSRRLLHERAARGEFDAEAVYATLRNTLDAGADATRRLRALWALHVTGGLDEARLVRLLGDRDEHVRAWAIQLLCEAGQPPPEALAQFAALAANDPSPVVRLYLASALQRLPHEPRWGLVQGLLGHADDATDQNLPLMYWYGFEPLVSSQPQRSLRLAVEARVPQARQFIARRYVDGALTSGDQTNLDLLAAALADESESAALDLLVGAREALRGHKRVPMPRGWPDVYARLKQSDDRAMHEQATMLALVFGDPSAVADLRATAFTPASPPAERTAALEALIEQGSAELAPDLQEALGELILRRTALRGLAAVPHPATPQEILARYDELTAEEKQEALATLASRTDFALAMLRAVERKSVPRADLSAYVARQLHALGDARVTAQLRTIWGEVRDTPPQRKAQIARYKEWLTPAYLKNADLDNGRLLYVKTCQACHVLYGEGGKIGPDLTGSNRANLDYLLANIVDPSAEIGRDYRMSVVETKSGRVITGMITQRGGNRLTVQTATERIVLAEDDVEGVEESTLSMMPEGQLEQLTRQQVRDLVAYLSAHQR